jgi:hypothetical protein
MGFLRHLGSPGGRGRGRDRTALLRQGTQGVGPSSPDTPDSHLPRWFCEKWVRMGKMGFLRHLGPPGGRGRGRDRTALLGQGTHGVGPSSPDTPDTHLPRWWGEKWGRMGKMGFLASFGGPRGGLVGVGARRPFGTGYPGSWDNFCLGHNTPIPRLLWVKNGSQGGPAQKNCRSSAGARKN